MRYLIESENGKQYIVSGALGKVTKWVKENIPGAVLDRSTQATLFTTGASALDDGNRENVLGWISIIPPNASTEPGHYVFLNDLGSGKPPQQANAEEFKMNSRAAPKALVIEPWLAIIIGAGPPDMFGRFSEYYYQYEIGEGVEHVELGGEDEWSLYVYSGNEQYEVEYPPLAVYTFNDFSKWAQKVGEVLKFTPSALALGQILVLGIAYDQDVGKAVSTGDVILAERRGEEINNDETPINLAAGNVIPERIVIRGVPKA